jgi:hypothetical protein
MTIGREVRHPPVPKAWDSRSPSSLLTFAASFFWPWCRPMVSAVPSGNRGQGSAEQATAAPLSVEEDLPSIGSTNVCEETEGIMEQ